MRRLLVVSFWGFAACSSGGTAGVDDGGGKSNDAAASSSTDLAGSDAAVAPGSDLATMPLSTNSVSIIVEPGDNGAGLLAAIEGAKTSVHMTMYLLTSDDITNALIARKKAGLDVKVVLNKTFPSSSTSNQGPYDTLKAAGVGVVWAPSSFTYTHEKCVIIDGSVSWIMTMNATVSAPTANREYLAIDTQAADIAESEAIFAADYAGTTWAPGGSLLVSPVNSRDKLVAFIGTAKSSVDLEDEELSDTKIVTALTTAKDAGLTVRVVLSDVTPSASQTSAIKTLKQHTVPVVVVHTPYIHAKAIVVDGSSAFVGSENFTTGSLLYNRELGITFAGATEVKKVADAISADFSNGVAQ
ncbi:MAG: phospholipase D-like domain-containing protein [Polyangia bacterium]